MVAALSFVNGNLAIRAWFSVVLQHGDRGDGVWVANVSGVIAFGLEFPAMCAGVLVACGALPGGRDEAVAVGISAAVNELLLCRVFLVVVLVFGTLTLQLPFGV